MAELGYQTQHARTSDEALRAMQQSPVQLLVIDDATPNLGALSMIAMAQPVLAPHQTAVIVLGRQDDGTNGLSGVTFVAPPFSPDDLREAVHAASWMRDLARNSTSVIFLGLILLEKSLLLKVNWTRSSLIPIGRLLFTVLLVCVPKPVAPKLKPLASRTYLTFMGVFLSGKTHNILS